MKIICKTTLYPPPVVRETRIRIKLDDPESLTWGIRKLTLAEGRERAVVDWGDGTTTEVTASGSQEHIYAQTGEYEVRISDDLSQLQCLMRGGTSMYQRVYAPMIREFSSDAALLTNFGVDGFYRAVNLSTLQCEESGVSDLGRWTLQYCTGLVGRLDLPRVNTIATESFSGSTGITELHFSKANEETIKALAGYATCFGAANAEIFFDL